MDEYYKVRVMAKGSYFDCWQRVANGVAVEYVADGGKCISPVIDGQTPGLPDPHEAMVLDKLTRVAPSDKAQYVWQAKMAMMYAALAEKGE